MAEKRVVWMPLPSAPAEFFTSLQAAKDEEAFYELLGSAHEKGWVEIFGVTEQDPKNLVAQLQEHFKVLHVDARDQDRGSR